MIGLAIARVKLDDETLGFAVVLVNGVTMALHPYVLAVGARVMAWLQPPAGEPPDPAKTVVPLKP